MARIAVFGLWHLGCVVAGSLAQIGHSVCGTDFDAAVIARLAAGEPPLFEPGLQELLRHELGTGRLAFTADVARALDTIDAAFITFDTPVDNADGSDLRPIERAAQAIAAQARAPLTVVLMSQVPVGTTRRLAAEMLARAPVRELTLLCQPENLRLGQALETFARPDRIVVGAESRAAAEQLEPLYRGIPGERLVMSWESAELAKHATNAFLATSVSFANELAALAEVAGADIRDVVGALRTDRRIGPQAFLSPGPGFAGGTLGRDVQALRRLGERNGRPTRVLDAVIAVNQTQLSALVEKLRRLLDGELSGRRIALLGLVYKPGTSTLRRSHALELARRLADAGATLQAYDPRVTDSARPELAGSRIALCADPYQAAAGADAVLLATPWPEFRALDWVQMRQVMRGTAVVDAHNLLDRAELGRAGLVCAGVGVPESGSRQPKVDSMAGVER
ncbi:MAG: nucleotide sugar dehydrogenase [Firmicutes bacterium]|nr:nucleotide sugar dehydrogenase [Bacillota bacterium]